MSADNAASKGGRLTSAVALCTYNGRSFIDEQVSSILTQSRPVNVIYIFDDVSDDGTYEHLQAQYGSNIKVVLRQNPQNLGYAKNFEQAVLHVKEDIVFLCDQDDRWHSDKVETVMSFFEADDDLKLFFGDMDLIDGNGHSMRKTLWRPAGFLHPSVEPLAGCTTLPDGIIEHNGPTGASMAMRSLFAQSVFPFRGGIPHDYWIAICAAAGRARVAGLGRPLSDYRIHPQQLIGNGTFRRSGKSELSNQIPRVENTRDTFLDLRAKYPNAASSLVAELDRVIANLFEEQRHLFERQLIRGKTSGRLGRFLKEWMRSGYNLPREWKPFLSDFREALRPRGSR